MPANGGRHETTRPVQPPAALTATHPLPVSKEHDKLPAGTFYNNALKDHRGKWSTSRIMLWIWTTAGLIAFMRPVFGKANGLHNPEWQAWAMAETFLLVAVFAPSAVASFLPNWGAVVGAIGRESASWQNLDGTGQSNVVTNNRSPLQEQQHTALAELLANPPARVGG